MCEGPHPLRGGSALMTAPPLTDPPPNIITLGTRCQHRNLQGGRNTNIHLQHPQRLRKSMLSPGAPEMRKQPVAGESCQPKAGGRSPGEECPSRGSGAGLPGPSMVVRHPWPHPSPAPQLLWLIRCRQGHSQPRPPSGPMSLPWHVKQRGVKARPLCSLYVHMLLARQPTVVWCHYQRPFSRQVRTLLVISIEGTIKLAYEKKVTWPQD